MIHLCLPRLHLSSTDRCVARLSCQVSSSRLRTQARPAVCHPHNNDRNTEQNKKKKQTNGRRDSVVSGVRRDAARQESVSRCNVDVGPCKMPPHPLPCQALVAAACSRGVSVFPVDNQETNHNRSTMDLHLTLPRCRAFGSAIRRGAAALNSCQRSTSLQNLETRPSG